MEFVDEDPKTESNFEESHRKRRMLLSNTAVFVVDIGMFVVCVSAEKQ